jgi:hypothetical protein
MTIFELKQKIDEKSNESAVLHKKLRILHDELSQLRNQFEQLEMEEFVNYLQIGEVIEVDNYYSFRGYCSDPKSTNSFVAGERFKIAKKNKKSIVIEVTKKLKRQWDEVAKKSVVISEYSPGWKIRVDLDSLFHFYFKSQTMKAAFDSYIKRKQTLDNLLND